MKINLHNYEAFFLDCKEGNLSANQEKELFLFLEEHPHLYEELSAFENIVFENFSQEEIFSNKKNVKKTDFSNENLIAYAEGLLDEKNKNEIETLASQNIAFKKELVFYKNAHVAPDLTLKFKNKSKLKRGGIIIALQNNYAFLRVAAAVLLLIGLFFLVSKLTDKENGSKRKVEIADVSKEVKDKNQEIRIKSQESENNNPISSKEKETRYQNTKYKIQNTQLQIQNVVTNTVEVNKQIVTNEIKSEQKDTLTEKIVLAENKKQEDQNVNQSYFNYSTDKDDNNTQPVTASSSPTKKSFFQKLVKVAKNVNNLGVKKVNATEEYKTNSLSIGSFVVSETTSN